MKGKLFSADFSLSSATLTIQTEDKQSLRLLWDEFNGTDVEVTVKKYHRKRSLGANALCWKYIGKIAEKIGHTKDEVYREFVKDCGIYDVLTMPTAAVEKFILAWETHGLGWQAESIRNDGRTVDVIAYYGTSVYNTAEMSRLINAVMDECKELGIETDSEAVKELLKAS